MRENFATVLEIVADVRAERTVVTHGDHSLTWGQLDERASRLAAFLAGRGVGTETRVAIAAYNGIEYLESVFAVLKLRAVPVNVNYRYQPDEMLHLFDDAQVEAVILDASLAPRVAQAQASAPALHTLIQVGGLSEAPASSYEQVIDAARPLPGRRAARTTGSCTPAAPPASPGACWSGIRGCTRSPAPTASGCSASRSRTRCARCRRSPSGKADLRWARTVASGDGGQRGSR